MWISGEFARVRNWPLFRAKSMAIKSTIFKTTDYKLLTSSPGTSSGPWYYYHYYFPIFTTLIHSSEPETARATSMSSTDEHILSFESLQSVQFAWNVSPIEDLALLSIQDHIPRSLCNILPEVRVFTVSPSGSRRTYLALSAILLGCEGLGMTFM